MIDGIGGLFLLILPLVLFSLGGLLLVRGREQKRLFERVKAAPEAGGTFGLISLRGQARSDKPAKGFVTNKPCVYSKLVLDYFDPKRHSWLTAFSTERCAQFFVRTKEGDVAVDPSGADIDIKKSKVYQEEKVGRTRSMLGRLSKGSGNRPTHVMPLPYRPERAEPYGTEFDAEEFDSDVVQAILDVSGSHKQILQYMDYRKKLWIYNIEVGDEVTIVGDIQREGRRIRKGADGLFLISDQEEVSKQFQGRYILNAVAGGAVMLASLALFFFLVM